MMPTKAYSTVSICSNFSAKCVVEGYNFNMGEGRNSKGHNFFPEVVQAYGKFIFSCFEPILAIIKLTSSGEILPVKSCSTVPI